MVQLVENCLYLHRQRHLRSSSRLKYQEFIFERNRLVGILINGLKWYSIPHIFRGPDYNHLIRKYFSLWNSHSYQIPNWLILKTMRDKRFSKALIAQIFLVSLKHQWFSVSWHQIMTIILKTYSHSNLGHKNGWSHLVNSR